MKRPTDKQRLDWAQKRAWGIEFEFFSWEWVVDRGIKTRHKSLRQAIDAAMRAEKKGKAK